MLLGMELFTLVNTREQTYGAGPSSTLGPQKCIGVICFAILWR